MELHLFGDSFTEGHLLDKTFPPYKKWKEYIGGELPPVWGDLLGKKLNCLVNNNAIAGMSNPEIFQTICQNSSCFKKGDIVIVNWTYNHRFRWVVWDNEELIYRWKRFSSNKEDGKYMPEIVRENIVLNRSHPISIEDVYGYEKILIELSKSRGFSIFFWSCDVDIINDLPTNKLINDVYILHDELIKLPPFNGNNNKIRTIFDVIFKHGGKKIQEETNYQINDGGHLGESGHKVQSELFYNYIVKNIKSKIL